MYRNGVNISWSAAKLKYAVAAAAAAAQWIKCHLPEK